MHENCTFYSTKQTKNEDIWRNLTDHLSDKSRKCLNVFGFLWMGIDVFAVQERLVREHVVVTK